MNERDTEEVPAIVRTGGWLFRQRTWLPLPFCTALLLIPAPSPVDLRLVLVGLLVMATGEWLRLLAVREIGAISRTRSDRLGPLVATGLFARVRNPIYLGSMTLWVGFSLCAGLAWLSLAAITLFGIQYYAIVRWEEHLLTTRLGEAYRAYLLAVPRWLPALGARRAGTISVPHSWTQTFFSERGTLIAIATGLVLLYVKAHLWRTPV